MLIDTGAEQANFVSQEVAQWLEDNQDEEGIEVCRLDSRKASEQSPIGLGGTNITVSTLGRLTYKLNFVNEVTNEIETAFCIKFKIIYIYIFIIYL